MIIDLSMPAYLMAAEDESRPMLRYCNVERLDATHGLLTATNGWGLVGVPVELDEIDVVGLVHCTHLEAAFKAHKSMKKSMPLREKVTLLLSALDIRIPFANMAVDRWLDPNDQRGHYPDLYAVIPNAAKHKTNKAYEDSGNQVALDPLLYYTASKAIGIELRMGGLSLVPVLYQVCRKSPLVWARNGWTETGRPIAPFMCLMPRGGLYLDDPSYAKKLAAQIKGTTYYGE